MTLPHELLDALNKLVHEPARFALMTILSACDSADFRYLQTLLGLTDGNLSRHLTKLEEAGLIEVTKQFQGKKPSTVVALTPAGREALHQHWHVMQQLHRLGVPDEEGG